MNTEKNISSSGPNSTGDMTNEHYEIMRQVIRVLQENNLTFREAGTILYYAREELEKLKLYARG